MSASRVICLMREERKGKKFTNSDPQGPLHEQAGSASLPGQETSYLGSSTGGRKQTYHGLTRTQLALQLAQVNSGAAAYAPHAALATHNYTPHSPTRRPCEPTGADGGTGGFSGITTHCICRDLRPA